MRTGLARQEPYRSADRATRWRASVLTRTRPWMGGSYSPMLLGLPFLARFVKGESSEGPRTDWAKATPIFIGGQRSRGNHVERRTALYEVGAAESGSTSRIFFFGRTIECCAAGSSAAAERYTTADAVDREGDKHRSLPSR